MADYALIRVIFEGAGSAWWVTSASTREERIKRSFRIVLDELEQADSREAKSIPQLRTAASRQTRQQALDRIRELTKQLRAEMDAAGIPAAASAKIIMPKILNSAGRATTDGVEYGFSTAWSMTSSVAHGALTSVLQLSDRTQRSDMIMSNPDSVLAFTDPAGALLTLTRQSWHRYARATA
ncbi:hypothetical protein [Labedella endophytica]|uniref:hypothetical protein n=1 Tax=Labedella endophytica TaxID=1523160 RepID=UPI00140E7DA3|nr:hypothetical protein [Labedella endophytica]